MELVDILLPPTFEKSGKVKTIQQAWNNEDWIGTFNLWIIQRDPVPAIVYQMRSPNSSWAPNKLDVTAGGHYSAGETIKNGLREVREELNKNYEYNQLLYSGKKLNISLDIKGRERHNVVDVFFIEDNSSLNTYALEKKEVYALCACPIQELIKVHSSNYTFEVKAVDSSKKDIMIQINKDSFPYNWDNYHFKIALLAQRFINHEQHLLY
ncbi:MAG TPA: NUDIX domain-containing protein [Candidatus Nitrosocosmicus sp.]|nr:NUDIX domain-containing protein [Candidatus Nitrosocosmicus sp.]